MYTFAVVHCGCTSHPCLSHLFEDYQLREHVFWALIFYFLIATDVVCVPKSPIAAHISFLRNISLGLLPIFQLSVYSVVIELHEFLIVLEFRLLPEVGFHILWAVFAPWTTSCV